MSRLKQQTLPEKGRPLIQLQEPDGLRNPYGNTLLEITPSLNKTLDIELEGGHNSKWIWIKQSLTLEEARELAQFINKCADWIEWGDI